MRKMLKLAIRYHLYLYLCDPLKGLLLTCNYITCHVILDSKKTSKCFISFIKLAVRYYLYLYLCDPLKGLLLTCNYTTSSINQHMPYQHPSNITCHVILDSKKTLKYFYLIHIIYILNFIFTVMF
jgi:hypothetical protein